MSQVCSGTSVLNHQKWSGQTWCISQIDNIKNSIQVSGAPVISVNNLSYEICLDDTMPDSIKKENDLMMSCPDRICSECGNDHSFRGNFEGVMTNIELLPELFPRIFMNNISNRRSL